MYAALLDDQAVHGPLPLRVRDILWAVHGIKASTSLGQEAVQKIKELKASFYMLSTPSHLLDVLWGADEARRQGIHYANQFRNPGRPPLHITSQAMLFILLIRRANALYTTFLSTVPYIVIDEDPTSSLVFSLVGEGGASPVNMAVLEEFQRTGAAGTIDRALLGVMKRVLASEFNLQPFTSGKSRPTTFLPDRPGVLERSAR